MRVHAVFQTITICMTTLFSIHHVPLSRSQHIEGTLHHVQSVADGEAALNEVLQSHPDDVDEYFPNKEAVEEYERYR